VHHINTDREVSGLKRTYDPINRADGNIQLLPMLRAQAAPFSQLAPTFIAIGTLRNSSIGTAEGMLRKVFGQMM